MYKWNSLYKKPTYKAGSKKTLHVLCCQKSQFLLLINTNVLCIQNSKTVTFHIRYYFMSQLFLHLLALSSGPSYCNEWKITDVPFSSVVISILCVLFLMTHNPNDNFLNKNSCFISKTAIFRVWPQMTLFKTGLQSSAGFHP